jgi:Aegerolysin
MVSRLFLLAVSWCQWTYLDHNACIDNKDEEIPISDIEDKKIDGGKEFRINSCGRENAPSGTEGNFDIYEDGGDEVRHFYWDCPWGGKTNTWTITGMKHLFGVHCAEQLDSRST